MKETRFNRHKKNLSELLLIFLFLFVLVLLGANVLRLIQIFRLEREILEYKEKIELTRAIDRKLGNIDAAYLKTQAKYNFLKLIIPDSPDDAAAARELSTLADQGNIIFIDLTRQNERALFSTELGQLYALDFDVEFLAKYRDASLFLKNLSRLARYFSIESVQMESMPNMLPNLYIKAKTETYYLRGIKE